MNEKYLVSIITPSFDVERFISQTIESVLAQTYKNWEMIIIDDMSSDNSNEIIESYIKQDSRIKLIKLKENSGPAKARNRGIKEAKGRYIAFLDADDLWKPIKLEEQIQFMDNNKCDLSYSAYDLIDESNNLLGTFNPPTLVTYISMLKTNSIGCLSAIYDTKNLGKVYFPNILKKQDFALWLEILRKIKVAKGLPVPLAIYRIRKNSVSSNKLKNTVYIWEIFRNHEKLNLFSTVYYFIYYTLNGLLKYKK